MTINVEEYKKSCKRFQNFLNKDDETIKNFLLLFLTNPLIGGMDGIIDVINSCECERKIKGGNTKEVTWNYYDSIIVDITGIHIKEEHEMQKTIIQSFQIMAIIDNLKDL